jgi:hypothetical protein
LSKKPNVTERLQNRDMNEFRQILAIAHNLPLSAYVIRSGGILAAFWRHAGGILAAFWRHSDRILAAF